MVRARASARQTSASARGLSADGVQSVEQRARHRSRSLHAESKHRLDGGRNSLADPNGRSMHTSAVSRKFRHRTRRSEVQERQDNDCTPLAQRMRIEQQAL